MIRRSLLCLSLLIFAANMASLAYANPRDAASVVNRCGKPLKGDTTIYESTVAGGRRILSYERGTLNFDRVANIGWTFTYGAHRKQDHLTADQMSKYMPCLKDALAAAENPAPLVTYTPVMRAEVSIKRSFKKFILFTFLALAGIGIVLFLMGRRSQAPEAIDETA